jgi:hypothetical protein
MYLPPQHWEPALISTSSLSGTEGSMDGLRINTELKSGAEQDERMEHPTTRENAGPVNTSWRRENRASRTLVAG